MHEGHGGLRGRRSGEEFKLQVGLVATCARRWARAVGETLAYQEVGGIGSARDMCDKVLVTVLGKHAWG